MSQEAVDICRRLAQSRPDAFLPDLAGSLNNLGESLIALERHARAASATREGLMVIAPYVAKHPFVFSTLSVALLRDYLAACERAGAELDTTLIERISRALQTRNLGLASDEDADIGSK